MKFHCMENVQQNIVYSNRLGNKAVGITEVHWIVVLPSSFFNYWVEYWDSGVTISTVPSLMFLDV